MRHLDFWNSFRVRLLLFFSLILLMTVVLQFVLAKKAESDRVNSLSEQEKALATAVSIATKTVWTQDYMDTAIAEESQTTDAFGYPFWTTQPKWCIEECPEEEVTTGRVHNVFIITQSEQVYDSLRSYRKYVTKKTLDPDCQLKTAFKIAFKDIGASVMESKGSEYPCYKTEYLKVEEDGKEKFVTFFLKNDYLDESFTLHKSVAEAHLPLPPVANWAQVDATLVARKLAKPKWLQPLEPPATLRIGDERSVVMPIPYDLIRRDTEGKAVLDSKGEPIKEPQLWFLVVVFSPISAQQTPWQIANPWLLPAVFTLALLLLVVAVWQFTKPVAALSEGARRIAEGDFGFRVPVAGQRNEMGRLATSFNEMTVQLARTRELEIQLNQAERSAVVGRLASAIAHEIRNPLTYINLTLDHFRAALAPEDPRKRETFDRLAVQLKSEVARINKHITELLNYARPARLDLQPLDLLTETRDAMRLIENEAAERNITTRIVQAEDMPPVLADRDWMRSILSNLMINSVQAINGHGGKLEVNIHKDDVKPLVYIVVADTGGGIPQEDLPKIFEPYFSTKETGTGLGLAIVKKAVEEHGGDISVASELGHGTTFTIVLPSTRVPDLN